MTEGPLATDRQWHKLCARRPPPWQRANLGALNCAFLEGPPVELSSPLCHQRLAASSFSFIPQSMRTRRVVCLTTCHCVHKGAQIFLMEEETTADDMRRGESVADAVATVLINRNEMKSFSARFRENAHR
uniref:Uncharacterized protein n=1 Tax=Plectus sambesii TaxID=2011161 RepID=A0A914WS33_9BILA